MARSCRARETADVFRLCGRSVPNLLLRPRIERVVNGELERQLVLVVEAEKREPVGDGLEARGLAGRVRIVGHIGAVDDARCSRPQKSCAPERGPSLTVSTCCTPSTPRIASAVRSSDSGVVISTRAPLSARR